MAWASPPISVRKHKVAPNWWDAAAAMLILALLIILAQVSRGLVQPLSALEVKPVSLDPYNLPFYAARTSLRMLTALALSLVFTFTYATLAAKNRRAGTLLMPLLDILQSVPILGFISITVVFFLSLAPGRILGAEFAAVFAIFTSQAWNMAFSFYQSLRTVPEELTEVSRSFHLSPWVRFWRLEVPFAMPSLIWNMMMSMSGGWFFVVASEAISVGNTTVTLPGVGSYIALAIQNRDLAAVAWAIGAMLVVILIFDQLLFRPLVAWAERFRFDQPEGFEAARPWVLQMLRKSRLIAFLTAPFDAAVQWSFRAFPVKKERASTPSRNLLSERRIDILWWLALAVVTALALWKVGGFITANISTYELFRALGFGLITMARVFVLIAIATVIWVPVGVWLGLRPEAARIAQPIAQFLAAFPANLLFPVAVWAIVTFTLNPNIWLSPLMILGTQWYILFNVIAGASTLPVELRDVGANLHVRGWLWWRKVALPGVFPFYVTGAITASGGCWNAAIVAELVAWGNIKLKAEGLGSYIAEATAQGDFHRIVLGICIMSAFVVVINRLFWRPLYWYAERRFRLG
jgi:NitT/TauT family transport system permease protein